MPVSSLKRRAAVMLLLLLAAVSLLAGCGANTPEPQLNVTLEQVGQDLLIKMDTGAFKIPEHGHLHVRLDDGPEAMPYSNTYKIAGVTPGKHAVAVELSDVGHKPLGVKVIKEIEIR